MKSNFEYRAEAHAVLKGHWTQPVLSTLIWNLIAICICYWMTIGGSMCMLGVLLYIIVFIPIEFTYVQNFLLFERDNTTEMVGGLFNGFKQYWRALWITILQGLYIFLWSFLLIIPGIIMSYAYRMAYFVAKDHPELNANKCLKLSKKILYGQKWKLFLLDLSFIGWVLLCLLTLGIGYLWLYPYIITSYARFYEDAKTEYELKCPIRISQ